MMAALGRIRPSAPWFVAVVVVALLAGIVPARAIFLSPAQKCELGKLKAAGKYHFCRVKVMSKSLKFGAMPDFSRCDEKFERKWVVLEEKAVAKGIPCPTEGDVAFMRERVSNGTTAIQEGLSGFRFVDNGDGTVADVVTGLMWEKKQAGGGCLHCANDVSTWVALAEWLSAVNGYTNDPDVQVGLGGHSDWRLPTVAELETLLVPPACSEPPCLDPALGAVPAVSPRRYWSSTTSAVIPTAAWFLDFDDGMPDVGGKLGTGVYFRAVRGGL